MRVRALLGICFLLGVSVSLGFYSAFILAPYWRSYEICTRQDLDDIEQIFIVNFSPIVQEPFFIWADSHQLIQIYLEKESHVYVEVFARDSFESPTKPISVYVVIQHEDEWSYDSHKSMFYYDRTWFSWDISENDNYIIRAVSTEEGIANITVHIYPVHWETSAPYRKYSDIVFFLGLGLIIGCPVVAAILILKYKQKGVQGETLVK